MKSLVIAPRFPWPAHTGERLRVTMWLAALSRSGEVALVSPAGDLPAAVTDVHFHAAALRVRNCVRSAFTLLSGQIPLQCLLTAPYDWDGAIDRAVEECGSFDVTVIVLSRMHPWIRNSLQGRTILDAVDSLGLSASERARAAGRGARWLPRWLWSMESKRMARMEREACATYGRVLVVSARDAVALGAGRVVGNGISASPLVGRARRFDFGFWGRLPYFANADAIRWLLDEIWPAIRKLSPKATLVIGGGSAPRSLRTAARRSGVSLHSPVADMTTFARDIRVALMPLRYGTGQSNKVLEAAEAGCALVGTPEAFRELEGLGPHVRVESQSGAFARAAADLLSDEAARASMTAGARAAVERHYARSVALDHLWSVAQPDVLA
jgi:glycosyltransferase involved in cell wall biosynthesis